MHKEVTLRETRQKLGLTQEALAEKLDITSTYVGMVERGVKPMSKKLRRKVMELSVSYDPPPRKIETQNTETATNADRITALESRMTEIEQAMIRMMNQK